ncbi:DUF2267 domain-containing protein [Haloparvum sp. PAK95]|uniref:DUF2267 domain-containing protein n=1 Tax=Haloparvum sp. PAK95 TaxID=3418962 RepID=UPI003D2F120B
MPRELVELAREGADFDSETDAEEFVRDVLEALGASLSPGERRDLAAFLPATFADDVEDPGLPPRREPFTYDEFIDHLASEAGIDADEAERRVRAVAAALARVVGEPELDDALAQLPPEYDRAFQTGGKLSEESFAEAVADVTDLSEPEAETAAAATLRTLGERVSRGEAEDVAEFLREPADEWLVEEAAADPGSFDGDEFVRRVAVRADVDEQTAREYADAASDALAGIVPTRALDRMNEQLPDEYGEFLQPIAGR